MSAKEYRLANYKIAYGYADCKFKIVIKKPAKNAGHSLFSYRNVCSIYERSDRGGTGDGSTPVLLQDPDTD
jgi:hypothetical protein